MKHLVFFALAALVATSNSAQAGDTLFATSFDWSGAYVGFVGGASWSKPRWDVPPPNDLFASIDGDGRFGGVEAGYNFQSGIWVYGVEAEIAAADIDLDDASFPPNCNEAFGMCGTKIKWIGDVSARGGIVIGPALVFGTAGLAFVGAENYVKGPYFSVQPGETYFEGSDNRVGFTVGGGVELALAEHLTTKVEYSYYDFGSASESMDRVGGGPAYPAINRNLTAQGVKIGLNYHF